MAAEALFSPDYVTARDRFRHSALAAGAELEAIELAARGPREEPLAIDIAWLGARDAERLLLHTAGMHGVEAYAGSAVQLAVLAGLPRPPAECALVLVHVLNPWGMAWLRRVDQDNVDLNRNFLMPGESWSGAPALYERIDAVLNPKSPPGSDGFLLAVAALALRHGPRALTQAIAEGQYRYPRGLFYGGAELQPGPRRYLDWLARRCGRARYVFALDLHTGLGRWGEQMLILEARAGATPPATLGRSLGAELIYPAHGRAAYVARGGMGACLPRLLPAARVDFILQELGTYPALKVLSALREENRWHHHGRSTIDHPSKRALLEALCPTSPAWRNRAVELGVNILRAACNWTFDKATGK